MRNRKRILAGICGLVVALTATAQNNPSIQSEQLLIPKRPGAEKFERKEKKEQLFISLAGGVGYLFNLGGEERGHGPKGSLQVGNWFTPVIGLRGGAEYGLWRLRGGDVHLYGGSVDYLMNLSAFVWRHNPRRMVDVITAVGVGYQAGVSKGTRAVHSYGLRLGIQGRFNVSSAFNLFIEPQFNLYPDRVDHAFSWRGYDLASGILVGVTYKPARFAEATFLRDGFVTIAVGTGKTDKVLFDTEFAIGKWLDKVSGVRISTGTSTAYLKSGNNTERSDFNINLSLDYLCNLSNLFSEKKEEKAFNLILVGGVGSYFPGGETAAPIVLNGRLGLQGQIRLSKHAGVWMEPRLNIFKDKTYRADLDEPIRATVGLMTGVSYKF